LSLIFLFPYVVDAYAYAYIVNMALEAFVMVVVETIFDADVGSGIGVDL